MRVYELMDFKKQLERTTDKKQNKWALQEHYKGVRMAESSEEVSLAFIEVATMLYNNVLCHPKIQALLFQLDQLSRSPFDSIYKIREVAVQCDKKEPLMYWSFSLISDWWLRLDGTDPIPTRSLKESGESSVSLVRLALFKKSLRDKLLRMIDNDFPAWETSVKTEIRGLVDSVEVCREHLGFYDNDAD